MRLPEVFESADNRYRVERYLGEGGSGRVYLVVCQEDSCCYALKVSADDEVSRVSLYREARILSSVCTLPSYCPGRYGRHMAGFVW